MKWPEAARIFDHCVFFVHPAYLAYLGGFKYSESTKPISTMIGNATMNSTISRFRFFVLIYK
jgi:hypothetical protein